MRLVRIEARNANINPVIVWFRDDLRLADNPALSAAARGPVVCLYVLDEKNARAPGGAARWWLAGSLRALDLDLQRFGNRLVLRRGEPAQIVPALAAEIGASAVHWNRRYERRAVKADEQAAGALRQRGVEVKTFHANLLREPSPDSQPPRVFTPFWRRVCAGQAPREPLPAPARLAAPPQIASERLDDWRLEPAKPDWAKEMRATWPRGEGAAKLRLEEFLDGRIAGYASRRERPGEEGTSQLSPHLRFGEISPFQVWHAATFAAANEPSLGRDVEKFLAELGWREFCYHLLHGHPDLANRNLQEKFDAFPWRDDATALAAWQQGRTGYPIVDAGMRQLWRTGWMHNRVRMVVASFLVKHLLLDWRAGERWFWDTLVDADPANNPAGWQWVAGCGADAAPYFRIFNPVLQGEKFDADGRYVREHVPELSGLPDDLIHKPWDAPPLTLQAASVKLGETYPRPIVEHAAARQRALAAFGQIKTTKSPSRSR